MPTFIKKNIKHCKWCKLTQGKAIGTTLKGNSKLKINSERVLEYADGDWRTNSGS